MKPGKVLLSLLCLLISASLSASGFSLAGFDLVSVGFMPEDADTPLVTTSGSISGRYIPASWVNFRAGVSFTLADTADFFNPLPGDQTPGSLFFDNASVNFRFRLPQPLGISFFTGTFDDPSSDSLLREFLKTSIDAPEFHELSSGAAFSPENTIGGTGFMIASVPGNANAVAGIYAYWNSQRGTDAIMTGDARIAAASDLWRLNAFAGLSIQPSESELSFRGAITALFASASGTELYVAAGVRNTEFRNSRIDRNVFLIFEPRLYWENADLALSFFSSPVFPENSYSTISTEAESNYLGASILAGFGNIDTLRMRGGVSLLGSINPSDPGTVTPFSFSVTPFYSMMVSDFLLTLSTAIKPLLLDDPETAMEICVKIKAVY